MKFEGLDAKGRESYQRDDFDAFLKSVKFSFNLPAIHIAGTNGKGSTAIYLASIYQKAGYKVGLFTSPALIKNNEMISINSVNITDEEAEEIIAPVKDKIIKYKLSEFEIETYIAFTYFLKEKCDVSIIECGMGGLIDATNVFTPILSIITSVSLEHTDFLGHSFNEVANHKAGIIKKEVPVLIGKLNEESEMTISEVAVANKSKLFKTREFNHIKVTSSGIVFSYALFNDIKLNSNAYYEAKNAALALEASLILKDKLPYDESIISNCFVDTRVQARLEEFKKCSTVVIDGAHNPEAIDALVDSMFKKYQGIPIHIIFANFIDKNMTIMLPKLSVLSKDLTLTTFDNPRARKEEDYFIFLDDFPFEQDYKKLIKEKMAMYPNDIILVTGCLAFAGIVSEQFKKGEYDDVCPAS